MSYLLTFILVITWNPIPAYSIIVIIPLTKIIISIMIFPTLLTKLLILRSNTLPGKDILEKELPNLQSHTIGDRAAVFVKDYANNNSTYCEPQNRLKLCMIIKRGDIAVY